MHSSKQSEYNAQSVPAQSFAANSKLEWQPIELFLKKVEFFFLKSSYHRFCTLKVDR